MNRSLSITILIVHRCSVLAVLALCLTWAGSYIFYVDLVREAYSGWSTHVYSIRGEIAWIHLEAVTATPPEIMHWKLDVNHESSSKGGSLRKSLDSSTSTSWLQRRGFHVSSFWPTGKVRVTSVFIPWWCLLAASGVLAVITTLLRSSFSAKKRDSQPKPPAQDAARHAQ